jgi:hypothetical protein
MHVKLSNETSVRHLEDVVFGVLVAGVAVEVEDDALEVGRQLALLHVVDDAVQQLRLLRLLLVQILCKATTRGVHST